MDIHRCRFIDFAPSAINTIAISPHQDQPQKGEQPQLAVGRANGDIELWNPLNGLWCQESIFCGGKNRSIEGLAWIQSPNPEEPALPPKPRLFSIGCSSAVTEWNVATGLPVRQSSGNLSEIWCIATQPPYKPSKGWPDTAEAGDSDKQHQRLAVGCADGSVALLSTKDDQLDFERYIARVSEKKARALCMIWKSRNVLAIGYADSSIRVYSISSKRKDPLVRTISLGGGPRGARAEKLVWALGCLPDGTLVSGDSTGEICWWDRENYGLLQKIQAHEADVLCLATSKDGRTIFSGGIDRKTVIYTLSEHHTPSRRRWAVSSHKRIHTHDVKAMASLESNNISVVTSGGPDAHLTIMPLAKHQEEYHRKIPFVPQKPPIVGARRLVLNWSANELSIWRVRSRHQLGLSESGANDHAGFELAARMGLKGEENIACACLSSDGKLLAVSTSAETKLFQIRHKRADQQRSVKIAKLPIPDRLSRSGARLLSFSPDKQWLLIVGDSNKPVMYKVDKGLMSSREITLKRLQRPTQERPWSAYSRRIACVAFSVQSTMLATADLAGHIDVWQLQEHAARSRGVNEGDSSSSSSNDSNADAQTSVGFASANADRSWRHTPAEDSPPQLPSGATTLSFSPSAHMHSSKAPSSRTENGRHDNDPGKLVDNDTLVVITNTNEIFEYSALGGRLTPWSRRNPPSALPPRLQVQRDRAIGCFWDAGMESAGPRKRLWVYGANWLCMIDMTQDLPLVDDAVGQQIDTAEPSKQNKRKRKRERHAVEEHRARHRSSGAGCKVKAGEGTESVVKVASDGAETSTPAVSRTVTHRQSMADENQSDEAAEEEVEEDGAVTALMKERRSLGAQPKDARTDGDNELIQDGDTDTGSNGPKTVDSRRDLTLRTDPRTPSYYLTTKYRPILSIFPLAGGDDDDEEKKAQGGLVNGDSEDAGPKRMVEVALVEVPEPEANLRGRSGGGRGA
ncbi:MAG: hypothetical protein Q9159_004952 [Coniocarpon cinnabarinum]